MKNYQIYRILLLIFGFSVVLSGNCYCQTNNFIRYYNALQFIKSSDTINNIYSFSKWKNDTTNLKFVVSEEILHFNPFNFHQEIYDYEFKDCPEDAQLFIGIYNKDYVAFKNSEMLLLNLDSNWNVGIYFSYIYENRLIAILKPNYGIPLKYSNQFVDHTGTRVMCLFYFNNKNVIIKSFIKVFSD